MPPKPDEWGWAATPSAAPQENRERGSGMNFKYVLLGTAAAVSIAALAQNNAAQAAHRGWYVGVEGGATWSSDNSFKLSGDVDALNDAEGSTAQFGKPNFDTGWA